MLIRKFRHQVFETCLGIIGKPVLFVRTSPSAVFPTRGRQVSWGTPNNLARRESCLAIPNNVNTIFSRTKCLHGNPIESAKFRRGGEIPLRVIFMINFLPINRQTVDPYNYVEAILQISIPCSHGPLGRHSHGASPKPAIDQCLQHLRSF